MYVADLSAGLGLHDIRAAVDSLLISVAPPEFAEELKSVWIQQVVRRGR